MKAPERIASFSVNHDYIDEGIYVSRIDGDIVTYDMRTRKPNAGDYMDNLTMHSLEHMFASYVRSGSIGKSVIYFGPMGCQTGFYLLVRDRENSEVLAAVKETLNAIISHTGPMLGQSREECGNYKALDLSSAKREAARYLDVLNGQDVDFKYKDGSEG